jgi:transposase
MNRKKYSNDFKSEAVRLAEQEGNTIAQVARDLGLHETVLRRWIGFYGTRYSSSGEAVVTLSPDERDELFRLRREVKKLEMERDILKKAVSIFSKDLP